MVETIPPGRFLPPRNRQMNWRPKMFQWLAAAAVVLTSLAATAAVKPNPAEGFRSVGSGPMAAPATTTVKPNPYEKIPERNVFNLLPIPDIRVDGVQPPPRRPPPQISITGLVELRGVPRALLEISEPGQPVQRSILSAGASAGVVEVLNVDVAGERVRVRIDGDEETLSIERPKPRTAAPPLPPGPLPTRRSAVLRG